MPPLRRRRLSRFRTALPFIGLWLVGFATLTVYPFLASLYWSFCRYDLLTPPRWIGLANYRRLADELRGVR